MSLGCLGLIVIVIALCAWFIRRTLWGAGLEHPRDRP